MDKTSIIALRSVEIMQLKEAKIVVPNKLQLNSKEIQVFTAALNTEISNKSKEIKDCINEIIAEEVGEAACQ